MRSWGTEVGEEKAKFHLDFSLFHRGCGNCFSMRIPFLWALAASLILSVRVVSAEEVQLVSLKDPIEDT